MTENNGTPETNGRQEQDPSGERDQKNGRFLPGNSGNPQGRPPGTIDFVAAVRKHAAEANLDMDKAAFEVARVLEAKALEGDVGAAKLWLDRCCGPVPKDINVTDPAGDRKRLTDTERAVRIERLLNKGQETSE